MSAAIAPMIGIVMLEIAKIGRAGATQSRAKIDDDAVTEYTEVLDRLPPSTVFFDGDAYHLADGFHRVAAHERSGRTEVPVEVLQGTLRDAVLHSVGANATHGLRRTNGDKQRAVEMLLRDEEWSARSDSWIAEKCAVDHKTVGRIREELIGTGELPRLQKRKGRDGKERRPPTPVPRTSTSTETDDVSVADAAAAFDVDEQSVRDARTVMDATPEAHAAIESGEMTIDEALATVTEDEDRRRRDEWFTPLDVWNDVLDVLNGIDLDPASCPRAQELSRYAKAFYSKDEDDPAGERSGLVKPWLGTVFLNPPYSNPKPFVTKLIAAVDAGDVPAAIVLVNNQTDASWFQALLARADACCLTAGRIAFRNHEGEEKNQTRQGQAFVFITTEAGMCRGAHVSTFERVFANRGVIVRALSRTGTWKSAADAPTPEQEPTAPAPAPTSLRKRATTTTPKKKKTAPPKKNASKTKARSTRKARST